VTRRPAAAVLGVALLGALLWRGAGRSQGASAPPTRPAARPAPVADWVAPEAPVRDIFRYAEPALDREGPVERRPAPAALPAPAPSPALEAPPPLPFRLVGFVDQGRRRRAALATEAGVFLVGPGDDVEGHTVLSLHPDRGLLVRAPDGRELLLEPPS
jgi:hypothetical protein